MYEDQKDPTLMHILKKSRLMHNTGLKIFSLMFAIIFWIYVMDQVNPMMTQTKNHIKVELLNQPSITKNGLILMNDEDYFVDVQVEGRRNDLFSMDIDDIVITADLDGYGKGKSSIPLNARSDSEQITIVDISQKDIKVFIDSVVEISKPVKLDIKGKPLEGYVQGKLSIVPPEVLVQGPESDVNSVASLYGSINLDGVYEGLTKKVPIKPIDNDGNVVRNVKIREDYISANLDIWKNKEVELRPNLKGDVKQGYALVDVGVVPTMVSVQGATKLIEEMEFVNTLPIDISGLSKSADVRIGLELPERVVSPSYQNALVKMQIEPLETKIIEIPIDDVVINNLPKEFMINPNESSGYVSVLVEDVGDVLKNLSVNDFIITADMNDVQDEKYYMVEVEVETKQTIRSVSVLENRLVLSIQKAI